MATVRLAEVLLDWWLRVLTSKTEWRTAIDLVSEECRRSMLLMLRLKVSRRTGGSIPGIIYGVVGSRRRSADSMGSK